MAEEKISRRVKTERVESRRQQVLDAAATCFRKSGFRGASMSDISNLAGMSTGHIYHYFKNKETIVEAIVERDQQQGLASIEELRSKSDVLEAMLEMGGQCMVERDHMSEPALFLEMFAEASRNPVVAKILSDCKVAIRASLIDLLKFAQDQGSVADDVPTELVCNILMTYFDGITVQSALNPDFDREGALQELRLLQERLLRPARPA